jgi:superfamily I DNA/RNA helicase/mRNA-degrading endonuclease RelE of RelBE toxin-antitoxin system
MTIANRVCSLPLAIVLPNAPDSSFNCRQWKVYQSVKHRGGNNLMNSEWVPTFKPSFLLQLHALPAKEMQQVLGKINMLLEDPLPHGKVKKQLTHINRNLYRLKSGDYRITYTFSDPYISILELVRRDDNTYDDDMDAEFLGGFNPDFGDVLDTVPTRLELTIPSYEPEATRLPQPITEELLTNLRVPDEYRSHLLAIQTEDDLISCSAVPQDFIAQIMEYMYPKPLAQVLQQPDYLLDDVDDLLRYKEGELLGFLLRLSPEQERFVSWAIKATGPTQVKGGPGTGKSTVALYRVRSLIEKLRKMGQSKPCILFTTYTNALVHSSEQLLQQLLSEDYRYVEVQTADKKMSDILKRAGAPKKTSNDTALIYKIFHAALKQTRFEGNILQQQAQQQSLERLGEDYLLEEINQVIVARQIECLQDYMHARRPGRKVRLSDLQKRGIWQVYETFQQHLTSRGAETWEQARARAETLVAKDYEFQSYDAVVIDEAQDLDPSMLRLLIKLCKDPSRLFITADANQSIYGSGFNWSDVHESLKFQGRTSVLRANYRSTREIGEAAQSYLERGILDSEPIERVYMNNGAFPAVRSVHNGNEETLLLMRFLRQAARDLRLGIGSCAILCPSNDAGKTLAENLTKAGLEATFMEGKNLDLSQKGVKVLTLNSAKGLEFPIVALAGFNGSRYDHFSHAVFDEEQEEDITRSRRVIFVGMTRAMRALLIAVPNGTSSPLLTGFDDSYWNVVEQK